MSETTHRISIEEILTPDVDICFVAMDFSQRYDAVYNEVMEGAIVDSGMRPVRSDNILSAADNVMEEVVKVIQASRIVVMDISGFNPNVMIELGIAHALKKNVIVVTQDKQVPFNIQARRVLFYDMSIKGKRRFREELLATLKSAVYPSESTLREMLLHGTVDRTTVVYGGVGDEHVGSVFPPVSPDYSCRLRTLSSEASGLWDIALAYHKIAWSLGKEAARLIAVDGHRASGDSLSRGNVFVFGGPAANPCFSSFEGELSRSYDKNVTILPSQLGKGKRRYRMYRGDDVYPMEQDDWLNSNIDVGMLVRAPNPFYKEGVVWIAAGVRSYGTEAAISALVRPSLINQVKKRADIGGPSGVWAIVCAEFDEKEQELVSSWIFDSGPMEARKVPPPRP